MIQLFNDTQIVIELAKPLWSTFIVANLFFSWAKFLNNNITKLSFWPRLKTIQHVIQVIK